jgi:hypothetical protein
VLPENRNITFFTEFLSRISIPWPAPFFGTSYNGSNNLQAPLIQLQGLNSQSHPISSPLKAQDLPVKPEDDRPSGKVAYFKMRKTTASGIVCKTGLKFSGALSQSRITKSVP